jgi:hypothetical protein
VKIIFKKRTLQIAGKAQRQRVHFESWVNGNRIGAHSMPELDFWNMFGRGTRTVRKDS